MGAASLGFAALGCWAALLPPRLLFWRKARVRAGCEQSLMCDDSPQSMGTRFQDGFDRLSRRVHCPSFPLLQSSSATCSVQHDARATARLLHFGTQSLVPWRFWLHNGAEVLGGNGEESSG